MMTDRDRMILKIGVSFTPGVTAEVVRKIEEIGMSLCDFFECDTSSLSASLGLPYLKLEKLHREEALFKARREMEFVEKHGIRVYYLGDEDYPMLLRETIDAPVVLYQLGETDLDAQHIINIVGTRRNTSYGVSFCENFIKDLAGYFPDLVVVSGLAYGIDSLAHKGALANGLPTVAVVAHGLDTIYPAAHRDLARRIIKSGGSIITEYPSGTTPFQKRFLERNRIVAGLSELTIVVESPIKGGAMSTANMAFSYSRDVGAVPGRVSDPMSEGCNLLIRKQKASLVTSVADIIEILGWSPGGVSVKPKQRNLFPELQGEAREIYEILKFASDPMSVDGLYQKTKIHIPKLTATLTEMEFDGIIVRLPGNRYALAM
ncbi:MAG: DNA-processing protein DprA [Muribaculaceae bacterium]|nr:DNA-processing protein DprA [Muribaculaceae bacterium]